MRTRRTEATLFVALMCSLTMMGCGLMTPSMKIDYHDAKFNDGLKGILDHGGSARLSDFTSWSWDEVHLFHEYTEGDFIEKTVGAPVIKSKYYESKASLLVFEDHGKPVKAIGLEGDYLRGADYRVSFPGNATVVQHGGGFMALTAPSG